MPPRLTRFFLSATSPPLLSHFYPRDFPSSLSKGAALRNFTGIFAARVYFPPRIFQFRDFPLLFLLFLLSLSLSFSFSCSAFPVWHPRVEDWEKCIVGHCLLLLPPLLLEIVRGKLYFLQLSKRTEVEGKWRSETFNTSALLLTWYYICVEKLDKDFIE